MNTTWLLKRKQKTFLMVEHISQRLLGKWENMSDAINAENIGVENEVHLCLSCVEGENIEICNKAQVVTGTGVGGDNICCCSRYEPVHLRMTKDEYIVHQSKQMVDGIKKLQQTDGKRNA